MYTGQYFTNLLHTHYNDLSEEDLTILKENGIINGCGGKGGWIKPPSFIFTASCDHHDWNYTRGGTEVERYNADLGFYLVMLQDARQSGHYWFYRVWAYVFFRAVRMFGYKFFNYTTYEEV